MTMRSLLSMPERAGENADGLAGGAGFFGIKKQQHEVGLVGKPAHYFGEVVGALGLGRTAVDHYGLSVGRVVAAMRAGHGRAGVR